jgi:voltage-gated potassium channel
LPVLLLVGCFLGGTVGYYIVGHVHDRHWSLFDCTYMTVITLTTVGFADVLGASDFDAGRIYTMCLLAVGMGTTLYSVSAVTAFIVEGHLSVAFREKRMERRIELLSGHTVICGAGATGSRVVDEHRAMKRQIVVVERDGAVIQHHLVRWPDLTYVIGDATSEETLRGAGIERASALVATLGEDKENLFLVVTARFLRPDIRIASEAHDPEAAGKFKAAGADYVVSTTFIGGMRIASQILRPTVVDFLDEMLRGDQNQNAARVVEAVVEPGSALDGKSIAESHVHEQTGLLIVALRRPGGGGFLYSPQGDAKLAGGTELVLIGPVTGLPMLERLARS